MVGCSALMMTRGRVLVRTTRPRDCYDACGVVARVEQGVISKAAGTRRTRRTAAHLHAAPATGQHPRPARRRTLQALPGLTRIHQKHPFRLDYVFNRSRTNWAK